MRLLLTQIMLHKPPNRTEARQSFASSIRCGRIIGYSECAVRSLLQAKNEDDGIGLREYIRPLTNLSLFSGSFPRRFPGRVAREDRRLKLWGGRLGRN